jgi:hypothetical protein
MIRPIPREFSIPITVSTNLEWSVRNDQIQFRGFAGDTGQAFVRVALPNAAQVDEVTFTGLDGLTISGKAENLFSTDEYSIPVSLPLPVDDAQFYLGTIAISHPRLHPPLIVRPAYTAIQAPATFGTSIVTVSAEPLSIDLHWIERWQLKEVTATKGPLEVETVRDDVGRKATVVIRWKEGQADKDSQGIVTAAIESESGKVSSCRLRVISSIADREK